MGIDQLELHSVQLGYLKILQMGNTDPKDTKAGKEIRGQASVSCKWVTQTQKTQKQEKKYEVKPQYEEASKQQIMQHAINQCYEMHEAIKESEIKTSVTTGKSSQVEPLYPHSVSTGEIIEFITRIIAMSMLKAVRAAQFIPHSFNLPQQISQRNGRTQPKQTSFLLTSSTSAEAILCLKFQLPEEPKNTRFRSHENLRTNRFFVLLSNADSGLLASINRKSNLKRIQRYQSRSKQRLEPTEI
ncbi:hypothetical protein F511_28391 [Dorcoceras hygrometricum]|uniref:Uncharacterized protein n=1 Tax=Dorcoceras hygrometricum TaxID=472368 RepID=A0A2Z7B1R3_9LAMI|nr:hypothetical protein F511_28391 [Dorcoceras hygrometricum]